MEIKICERCCSPIFRDEQFTELKTVVASDNRGNVFWAPVFFHGPAAASAGLCVWLREDVVPRAA